MLRYANRALAVVYMAAFVGLAAWTVGTTSSAPMTWAGALRATSVLAVGMWLAWQAGRESKAPQ